MPNPDPHDQERPQTRISSPPAAATIAGAPIASFVDTVVLTECSAEGDYGRHRLFGSIGWGLMSLLSGALMGGRTGLVTPFLLFGLMGTASLLPSWRLDFGKVAAKRLQTDRVDEEAPRPSAAAAEPALSAPTQQHEPQVQRQPQQGGQDPLVPPSTQHKRPKRSV